MVGTGGRRCKIFALYRRLAEFGERRLMHVLLLAARALLGYTFFASGLLKLPAGFLGIGKGDWSATLALFESEYRVPLLPADVAAYMATGVEIVAPLLLWLGLGTRFAAAALCAMILVIQFTYTHDSQHFYWLLAGCLILCRGAGIFSVDHLIATRHSK